MTNNIIKYIPDELIKYILLFSGTNEIIIFQDIYPYLIKYINVTNLTKINQENYKYIKQLIDSQ